MDLNPRVFRQRPSNAVRPADTVTSAIARELATYRLSTEAMSAAEPRLR
jgi:hypothetical protein